MGRQLTGSRIEARELPEGTVIAQQVCDQGASMMVFVRYPHRKTTDLYMTKKGRRIHCCQCATDIPRSVKDVGAFIEHIRSHDSRKKVLSA